MSSSDGIERLIRPELAHFCGYSACKSPDVIGDKLGLGAGKIIKLDANENNYGASPRVKAALSRFDGFNIYPDALQTEVRRLLSAYTGTSPEHIVAGSGSDQLIDLLIRLFCSPGDEIIDLVPTFAMFCFYANLASVRVVEAPRDDNFYIDVSAIKKAITNKTKLIFIANPNNPTGTLTERRDILEVLDTGLPTVVDEAYYEFTGETVAPSVGRLANLMVLRTFSKWAGLAGLRVGYGLFPTKVADYLHAIRDPYNVNVAALVAVRESFQDTDYLMGNVRKIIAERERLFASLKKIRWLKPYPSRANFILCDVLKGSAKALQVALEARGILVRYFAEPRLTNCIRFSVGKPEEDDILLKALSELGEAGYG